MYDARWEVLRVWSSEVKKTPHITIKMKNIPWSVCKCCGLVYLRNEATKAAIRAGCEK
jgi:hypothetical protein